MKTQKLLILLLLIGVLFSACSPPTNHNNIPINDTANENSADDGEKQYTIALVMKTLTNPFFVEMEKGARQAEEEFGISLIVKTGAQETSVEQQITIIDSLIVEGVDAIVIAPADSVKLIPVLKKAQNAGIVIVNIDNILDPQASAEAGLVNVPIVTVDNEQGAYLSASFLNSFATNPVEAAIFEGIRSAQNAEDRKNGALRAFDENENITVVAMETANWKIDEAYDVAVSVFEEHPDIKLVFCANDMMALGVIRYLEDNGKTDVKVAAYDALDEAKAAILAGSLQATIDQQAALQGYTGIYLALQLLRGEEVPYNTIADVRLVTLENLDE